MAIQKSFTGEVINPIIDARLRVVLSSTALAKKLGLSRQYLNRAEQGTYSSLNPALKKWTANTLGIGVTDVEKRYLQFQNATRAATVESVDPHKLERHENNTNQPGYQIFEQWRSGYWPSSFAFSNAFCIHPETVRNYEEGMRPEMPTLMVEILTEFKLIDPDFEISGPSDRSSQFASKARSGQTHR